MFFKLLKLAGIDVNAKIAELKADLELKAQQVTEHASFKARNLALIAGLFLCASIFVLFALIVGLIALYHWAELHYGPYTGLALVAASLLILAALCVGVALSYTNSRPDELPLRRIVFSSPPAARNLFHRAAAQAQPNALIPRRRINQLLSGVRIWLSRFWCCLAPTCVSRLPATLQSTIS